MLKFSIRLTFHILISQYFNKLCLKCLMNIEHTEESLVQRKYQLVKPLLDQIQIKMPNGTF